jgi:hypothetical protein
MFINILKIKKLRQGHLNSIIGSRAKQCTGGPTYTTTHRNKNVNGQLNTCLLSGLKIGSVPMIYLSNHVINCK